ncbi:heterokaryon incompatibility protein-domain-containing protein [Podospora aff. communis PSN243]|uniref:Heterokaryon incompatibility protein-domain-containing protein n=1 Tax=Podospora aff. communis PSN243 TaxID=3040156 RepID=A0AAV9GU68_9PEZI|nr:heterokaryon incompatibility protein-domain-containing protein [Podospora aff. communis PSN243]
MWLINTTTLDLEYFIAPEKAPPYAVLSHTWGDEELSFAEFRCLDDAARHKRGYDKIHKTCQFARDAGIQYAWVDTCCIDKSSSAELTEAINSMYNYYRRSVICYAYIDDWLPDMDWVAIAQQRPLRWFTRGWTLQELIAPKQVQFCDASWTGRGFKGDPAVMRDLSRITQPMRQSSYEIVAV